MNDECGSVLASCYCALVGEHEEHVCADEGGTGCAGRWTGEPHTPSLTITQFPSPPPQQWYDHYQVGTLAELLEAASIPMRLPLLPSLTIRRGGIQYPTNGATE